MSDPFDSLVREYASIAGDFHAQRKRLREARMRWIEENECPTSYKVDSKGNDGTVKTFETPFQVGQLKYPDVWTEDMKQPAKPLDAAAEKQMLEGLDAILEQQNSGEEPRLTILMAGDEQHAFITGTKADVSPHPAIEEGEDYGEYYARVSSTYERQAGAPGNGRPVTGNDGIRESAPTDPAGGGHADAPGDGPGPDARPMLGSDTDALHPGDLRDSECASSAPTDTIPATDPATPTDAATDTAGGNLPTMPGE